MMSDDNNDGITTKELLTKLMQIQDEIVDQHSGSLRGHWIDDKKILSIVRDIIRRVN